MKALRTPALVALGALGFAACDDAKDTVSPRAVSTPNAPASLTQIAHTQTRNDLTATVTGPDSIQKGGKATYTIDLAGSAIDTTVAVNSAPIDIVFVMDASGSVTASGWTQERNAVASMINTTLPANARVGVVVFSDAATTKYTFQNNQTRSAIVSAVNALVYVQGSTATLSGMQNAYTIFNTQSDSLHQHIVVLITDGTPNPTTTQNPCGTSTAAQTLRTNLTRLHVRTTIFGVGPEINAGTLSCLYDNDPSRFIAVAGFSSLDQVLGSTILTSGGLENVRYTATIPASFHVDSVVPTQGTAGMIGNTLNWSVGEVTTATRSLKLVLTGPAACGPTATLTNQKVTFTATTGDSLLLADQSTQISGCDTTAPTIAPTITGTAGANGWYTSDVTVHFAVADAESGVSTSAGCDDVSVTTDTDGTTFVCSATNGVGLTSADTVTIKRDATTPTLASTVTGTMGAAGWYTSDVGVTWAATFGPSGANGAGVCGASAVVTDTNEQVVICTVASAAGLSATKSVSVKRDASHPAIVPSVTGTLGNNGWYTSNVSVSFTTSYGVSGAGASTGCTASTVSADTNGQTFTCTASTAAGSSSTQSVTVKRDATKPVLTFGGAAGTFTVDQSVGVTCSATDATSGIASTNCASVTGPAYNFNIGANAVTGTATDNAGNVATASGSFTVSLTTASFTNLINRMVHGDGLKTLLNRMKNITDKVNKQNPSLDSQIKNFLKELDRAQQDGDVSAADAAVLSRLVQLFS